MIIHVHMSIPPPRLPFIPTHPKHTQNTPKTHSKHTQVTSDDVQATTQAVTAAQQQRGAPIPVFLDTTTHPGTLAVPTLATLAAAGASGVLAPLGVLAGGDGGVGVVVQALQVTEEEVGVGGGDSVGAGGASALVETGVGGGWGVREGLFGEHVHDGYPYTTWCIECVCHHVYDLTLL